MRLQYSNLPPGFKKIALFRNGKMLYKRPLESTIRLTQVLDYWEQRYPVDNGLVAAHITHKNTLRTFVRTEPGIWLES